MDEKRYYAQEQMFHGHIPRIMGTRFDLLICSVSEEEASKVWNDCKGILEKYDQMMNRFSPDSEVSAVNRGIAAWKTALLSEEMAAAMRLCMEFSARTGGLHDITLGKMSHLHLDGAALSADVSDVALDFGGFAKGLAVRKIAERLDGLNQALVDFGSSSILAIGTHPAGNYWPVTLNSTYSGAELAEFHLKDTSLSISGNTPGYSGHIVNPLTGRRVDGPVMASAMCKDPLTAEVLSTALLAGGQECTAMLSEAFPEAEMKIYGE